MRKDLKKLIIPGIIIILAVIFLIYWKTPRVFHNVSSTCPPVLHVNENGDFKILIFADIQDEVSLSPYTLELMEKSLDSEKPDLVVLLGDNIYGFSPSLIFSKSNVQKAIYNFLKPITERNIPFCLVFGNHDCQTVMSEEEQLSYYQSFQQCLANDTPGLTGTGNYNVLVYDESCTKPVSNLWFFDSGSDQYSFSGVAYECVKEDQVNWYKEKSAQITAENGSPIPAFAFQHIPVAEINELIEEVPLGTQDAVEKHGKAYVPSDLMLGGTFGELPCSSPENFGQFDAFIEMGDVKAAFFGHDHVNDFYGTYQGVDLEYVAGTGFYFYGSGYNRGVRVLEFNESDPTAYTSRMVYYSDLTDTREVKEEDLYDGTIEHGWEKVSSVLVLLVAIAMIGASAYSVIYFIIRVIIIIVRSAKGKYRVAENKQ